MIDKKFTPPSLSMVDVVNLFEMTQEELMMVPHEIGKWRCCAQGCKGFAKVRHFGIFPLVRYRKEWIDLSHNYLYCGKHWRIYKKQGAAGTPVLTYKPPHQILAEMAAMFTIKPDNMEHRIVTIPVEEDDMARFKRWTDHYGMTIQTKKKDLPYVEVIYIDALDLYWLGANYCSGNDRPKKETPINNDNGILDAPEREGDA